MLGATITIIIVIIVGVDIAFIGILIILNLTTI